MTRYYLPQAELRVLVDEQRGATTFAPTTTAGISWFDRADSASCVQVLSQPRSSQSPKGFFFPPAESMGRYGPGASGEAATATQAEPVVLLGVRACALRARNYLDKVLLEGTFEDPLYRQRREATKNSRRSSGLIGSQEPQA